MDKPEQRFKLNTRVKLREGVDPSFYDGFGRAGNEGWVRKRKRDKYGYPQVLIEWDKDHWAYNGQEDCWTWEGQFEAVNETMSTPDQPDQPEQQEDLEDNVRGITENFVKALFGALGAPVELNKSPDSSVATPVQGSLDQDQWQSLATQAGEAITKSPAYLVIALEYLDLPEEAQAPIVIPRVFHASQKAEYALIIQSQLAHLLASLQDDTIAGILQQQVIDEGS